jgi:hypothetical protein
MTLALAAPFPYFGGKRRAAPRIWQALGDPRWLRRALRGISCCAASPAHLSSRAAG